MLPLSYVHALLSRTNTQHVDFGAWPGEPTNELWWTEFDQFLIATHGEENGFYRKILPQIRATTAACFGAVQPQLGNHRRPPGSYVSFQVRAAAP